MTQLLELIKPVVGGSVVAIAVATIGSVTGCNDYVLTQIEKDVATSTIAPRMSDSELSGTALIDFQRQAAHANEFLAKANGGAK